MKGKNAKILLFLVPSILLLTVFVYYPVICNIGYSFFNMSSEERLFSDHYFLYHPLFQLRSWEHYLHLFISRI